MLVSLPGTFVHWQGIRRLLTIVYIFGKPKRSIEHFSIIYFCYLPVTCGEQTITAWSEEELCLCRENGSGNTQYYVFFFFYCSIVSLVTASLGVTYCFGKLLNFNNCRYFVI